MGDPSDIIDDIDIAAMDDGDYPSELMKNYARGIVPSYMAAINKRKNTEMPLAKRRSAGEPRMFQFIPVHPGLILELAKPVGDDDDDDDIDDGMHPMPNDVICVIPATIPPIVQSVDSLNMRDVYFLNIDTVVDQQGNSTTVVSTVSCRDIRDWKKFDILLYSKYTSISAAGAGSALRLEAGTLTPVDQICRHIESLVPGISRSTVVCVMFTDTGHCPLIRKVLAACHTLRQHAVSGDMGLFDFGVESGIRSIRSNIGVSSATVEREMVVESLHDKHSHDLAEAVYRGLTTVPHSPLHDVSPRILADIQKIVSSLARLCARDRATNVFFSAHPVPSLNSTDILYLTRDSLV